MPILSTDIAYVLSGGAGNSNAAASLGGNPAALPVPGSVGASPVGSGGTFGAGTYYWKVTALNAAGETIASAEVNATVVANGSANITWGVVTGATSYRVYRGTATGAENVFFAVAGGGSNSFTDTGAAGTAGTPPTWNGAFTGPITSGQANNLWADVTGAQSAAGLVDFRAYYVYNKNATLTWQTVIHWIDSLTSSPDTEFDVALASEAVNTAIAQTLGTETSVPTGVTFTRPTTKAGGLTIGNITPGQFKGLWIRRTVNAGAAAFADSGSIRCEGDTGP